MMEIQIGKVTHYYTRIGVGVLELSGELKVGDTVHIMGRITDFIQPVGSMEIEHQKVETVGPGDEVALKVDEYVRAGDTIFKVMGE
jgi:translation elongation factor EF-1alpha